MKETLLIKHFGPLQEVQLSDIPPYVFLIGPSGSGKSTLLKVVALMRWIYKMMCIRFLLAGFQEAPPRDGDGQIPEDEHLPGV